VIEYRVQKGGLGCVVVAVAVACGESGHSGAGSSGVGGDDGVGGAGGSRAAGGRVGTAGAHFLSSGGALGTASEAGAPSVAGTAPIACETGPAVPLLRPGCPVEVPRASDCPYEGLICLYPGETADCFVQWECVLGLWSPRGTPCRDAESGADPTNPEGCTSYYPVDGEPCEIPNVECRYGPCGVDFYSQQQATCVCARFRQDQSGCPVTD
jgi:hypothetical protein